MLTGRTGKGLALAFFLIFICHPAVIAQPAGHGEAYPFELPEIKRLDPGDLAFKQYTSDVHANRRRLAGARGINAGEFAEHLTIYQYRVKPEDDILFLAARLNIPYSALASLNGLNNPSALQPQKMLLLPSCPGIFIPSSINTDLEKLLGAARQENNTACVEIKIRSGDKSETYLFFPGADFTPTERAFFLNSGFRFPLRQFRVTSRYGIRNDPISGNISMHRGIDLAAPEGTEVFAAAEGVVTAAGFDPVYGNYVIIRHSNGWTSLYGHLQIIETVLRTEVKSGNLIGRVGTTGQSTGPHLHFELRQDGKPFDPAGRLRP